MRSTSPSSTTYVDHLHEYFANPVRVESGRYLLPERPGYSVEMHPESLERYEFPAGPAWSSTGG